MATNLPTGLDSLTNPTATDNLSSPTHSDQHANANDAIEAIGPVIVGPLVYNVKGYGAVGDGSTDDTTAIQSAIDAAIAAGGGIVLFPEGTYLTTAALNLDGASNVTLQGVGQATITNSASNGIEETNGGDPSEAGLTYYDLTGTHNRGDTVLNLATAADAANFTAGDYIWVRTRQLLATGSSHPIAELNRVVSSDDVAGTVTLQWPLAKEYTDDATNTYGVAVTTNVGLNNAIRGLRIVATAGRATSIGAQLNFTVSDCVFEGISFILVRGRFITVQNNRGHLDPDWATLTPLYFSVDRGTCDVIHQGNYWSSEGFGGLHIHEGVADFVSLGNTYLQAGADGEATSNRSVFSILATAWDIRLIGETVINSPNAHVVETRDSAVYPGVGLGTNGLLVTGLTVIGSVATNTLSVESGCTGAIVGNRLLATSGTHALNLGATDFAVSDNDFGSNTVSIASGVTLGRNRGGGDLLAQANTWSGAQTFNGNNFAETDAANTWSANQALADAINIALGTTTGTQIGTATTQKLGFFGATPIAQQANTSDLKDLLVALGFLASGGATPLDLDNGDLTGGALVADKTGSGGNATIRFGSDPTVGMYLSAVGRGGLSAGTGGPVQWEQDKIYIPTSGSPRIVITPSSGFIQWANGSGGAVDVTLHRPAAGTIGVGGDFQVTGQLDHQGSNAGFFGVTPTTQPTALTLEDGAVVDSTYDQTEADVINNLRTRLGELETKLQSLGLLA